MKPVTPPAEPDPPMLVVSLAPRLSCLAPLMSLWAAEVAASKQQEQRSFYPGPHGVGMLATLARERGWQLRCGRDPFDEFGNEPAWPVGWARSIYFSLRPPGSSARLVFVRRRLVPRFGALPDLRACERMLQGAHRVLRRQIADPDDVGIAALELLLTAPQCKSAEARWLADLRKALMTLQDQFLAVAGVLHIVRDRGIGGEINQSCLQAMLVLLVVTELPATSNRNQD